MGFRVGLEFRFWGVGWCRVWGSNGNLWPLGRWGLRKDDRGLLRNSVGEFREPSHQMCVCIYIYMVAYIYILYTILYSYMFHGFRNNPPVQQVVQGNMDRRQ